MKAPYKWLLLCKLAKAVHSTFWNHLTGECYSVRWLLLYILHFEAILQSNILLCKMGTFYILKASYPSYMHLAILQSTDTPGMVSSDVVSPLCYTTDESKTFLWCKLCLTFTGSVTECSLKKPHHIATLLFSEVVNDHTTREWNPLYHFRTYVIIIIINYCRKIAIYPCLRTLLNVFNTYYHVYYERRLPLAL